jgi:hypothetical protein
LLLLQKRMPSYILLLLGQTKPLQIPLQVAFPSPPPPGNHFGDKHCNFG